MNLVGGRTGGSTDGIAVGKLCIPTILPFVDDQSEHLSHGVVHVLDAAVAIRMIRACCNCAHTV